MHRIFLGLAVTVVGLLAATFGSGFLVPSGRGGAWRDIHFLLSLLVVLAALLAHSVAFTYLLGTGKWVKEVERVYAMTDGAWDRARRNKKRAFPFEFWGMMLVGVAAWLGAAVDTRHSDNDFLARWHLIASAIAIAFNLLAFVAEYFAIVAQAELLVEVKGRADRLREARLAESHSPDART